MGKTKGKSLKLGAFDIQHDLFSDLISAAESGSPLKAADGHNVDGWADEDIRTYNELLNERAKLEKEKTELEQKSSRHQTQRALLDEHATALDNLFKPQLSGDFKFTGHGTCCLDADTDNGCVGSSHGRAFPCKHEVCKRAKTKGVSWMEMDTIKYYHARIMAEKSQRMQKALRKQRDVELVRVKKDDEEEFALRNRKTAILDKATRPALDGPHPGKSDKGSPLDQSTLDILATKDFLLDPRNSAILEAAKENEHIVRRIRARLDKIRHDVNAGRVSPADARVKLDQANSEMADAEKKNNEFRQMILDAEPTLPHIQQQQTNPASLSNVLSKTLASSNADAFSQALTVMKGFFSASDPHDVQTAITDLRSVLELNGPMSPVLQKSFQALEDMLAKPNAKGFTVDVTTADGQTRTCNNVVEVMMNLRLKMQGKDPQSTVADTELNMDKETMEANRECQKTEAQAKEDMKKVIKKMAHESDEKVMKALSTIKTRAVLKSRIPPLSDIVIGEAMHILMAERSLKALTLEARKGSSLLELSGKLTKIVITGAQKQPEKYMAILSVVQDQIRLENNPPQALLDAFSKVETQMSKFVATHVGKKRAPATNRASASTDKHAGGATSEHDFKHLQRLFDPDGNLNDAALFRDCLALHYRMYVDDGPWEMFRVYAENHAEPQFVFEPWNWEMDFYQANMSIPFPPAQQCLDLIVEYQSRGICPGQTALVIAQRLTHQIRIDFEGAKNNLKILKSVLTQQAMSGSRDWFLTFNFIGQAMIDLFFILTSEIGTWEKHDAPIMAMDIVGMACTFSFGANCQIQGYQNLKVLEAFMASVLINTDRTNNARNLDRLGDVMGRFYHMCDDPRYLCNFRHACRSQVQLENKDKFIATFPMPSEVEESRREQMDGKFKPKGKQALTADPGPSTSLTDILQGMAQGFLKEGTPGALSVADTYALQAQEVADNINLLDPRCFATNVYGSQLRHAIRIFNGKLKRDFNLYPESNAEEQDQLLLDIQSHIKDLKDIHMVLSDGPLAQDVVTTARFFEILDEVSKPYELPEPVQQKVSLKHVTRKSPSMVKSGLHFTSKSGNVQDDLNEAIVIRRLNELLSGSWKPKSKSEFVTVPPLPDLRSRSSIPTTKPVLPDLASPELEPSSSQHNRTYPTDLIEDLHNHTHAPSTTTPSINNPSAMSPLTSSPTLSLAEEKIKQQLTTFLKGVLKIDTDADNMTESVHKDVFKGVAKHLQNMARGHVEMAWIVAKGQDYTGLQAWLKVRFPEACGVGPSATTFASAAAEANAGATSTNDNEEKVPDEGNIAAAAKPAKSTRDPTGRRGRKGRKH
ncbi:hypothetical protein LTR84_012452 [Exophiala bonariae]|uniref:Uncharacterized protein n=1 Tax=Exophiala bonariae TaxID=1690606 RepID=A0AAV9NHM4_9EURO|nr:hypothetical protein LTR84_012452 [Exophiala bonariae]